MIDSSAESLMSFRVYSRSLVECLTEILDWVEVGDRCKWLACINPHSFIVAKDRQDFELALRRADWLVPDGVGMVLASRLLGGSIRRRITGSDVFAGIMAGLQSKQRGRVFLLGSNEETLQLVKMKLSRDFPAVDIVGHFAPPYSSQFSAEETRDMIDAVNRSRPDVLWVMISAPKQELWLSAHSHKLEVRFAAAIGAVIDFYAGTVPRSGAVARGLGFEWLPRLLREPRRLWRRTFVSAPRFLWAIARERAKRA